MLAIVYGFLSALSWGAGDFCGGLSARRASLYAVVVTSQGAGALALLALALLFREALPPLSALGWGALAGAAGAVGLLALYGGLATGQMGLVAPISAVLAAALPIIFSFITEGSPTNTQWLGFALALVGVWFLSRPANAVFRWRDLMLPLAAGGGFGLFFVLLHQGSATAVFWPLVAARATALLFIGLTARTRGDPLLTPRPLWPLSGLAGVLDAGGNAFFALAAQTGRLDVASVLSSLYPASTVILAATLLKERLTRAQWFGALVALTAIGLITAGSKHQ